MKVADIASEQPRKPVLNSFKPLKKMHMFIEKKKPPYTACNENKTGFFYLGLTHRKCVALTLDIFNVTKRGKTS